MTNGEKKGVRKYSVRFVSGDTTIIKADEAEGPIRGMIRFYLGGEKIAEFGTSQIAGWWIVEETEEPAP